MGNSDFLKDTTGTRVSLPLAGMAIPCLLWELGQMRPGRKECLSKKCRANAGIMSPLSGGPCQAQETLINVRF
ncbi:hypothetical protein GCM10027287_25120 [Bordetella muralis]